MYESANFKLDKNEKRALVRCPECHQENYAPNVLQGVCTWCGFDINEDLKVPNEETAKAIEQAIRGEGTMVCKNIEDMFDKLDI
jgi:hypothetical protein